MTKREAEALDEAKRVLLLAETASPSRSDMLIQVADRWLVVARQSAR